MAPATRSLDPKGANSMAGGEHSRICFRQFPPTLFFALHSMFKRVAKRQRKAETKERTLEDQPEYSESGSELDEDAASSSSHSDSDDSSSGSDSDEDQEQAAALPAGTLTVKDAFEDPIFSSVLDESVQSCAFCTGVLLKNEHMVKTHLSAKV
jgi:hypothetical protein